MLHRNLIVVLQYFSDLGQSCAQVWVLGTTHLNTSTIRHPSEACSYFVISGRCVAPCSISNHQHCIFTTFTKCFKMLYSILLGSICLFSTQECTPYENTTIKTGSDQSYKASLRPTSRSGEHSPGRFSSVAKALECKRPLYRFMIHKVLEYFYIRTLSQEKH